MSTTLDEPTISRTASSPAHRLRTTMAAVRVSLSWLGVRKTLSQEQKAQAADTFGAEEKFLSAGKKLIDTTHPAFKAVTGVKSLCEGEGRTAIRSALAEGRLCDFFVLVAQILATYGRGRAYVELDHWDGVTCKDCGSSIAEDDRYTCERRDAMLCGECHTDCPECGRTCCSECTRECSSCGQAHCRRCLEDCLGCSEPICPSCRHEGYCEECHEQRNHPNDPQLADGSETEPTVSEEALEAQGCL
jgi:hypothetical protein